MLNIISYAEYKEENPDKMIDIEAKIILTEVNNDLLNNDKETIENLINRFGENYFIDLELIKNEKHFIWFKDLVKNSINVKILEKDCNNLFLVFKNDIYIGCYSIEEYDGRILINPSTYKDKVGLANRSIIEDIALILLEKYSKFYMLVNTIGYNNRFNKMGFTIEYENEDGYIIKLEKKNLKLIK